MPNSYDGTFFWTKLCWVGIICFLNNLLVPKGFLYNHLTIWELERDWHTKGNKTHTHIHTHPKRKKGTQTDRQVAWAEGGRERATYQRTLFDVNFSFQVFHQNILHVRYNFFRFDQYCWLSFIYVTGWTGQLPLAHLKLLSSICNWIRDF